MTALPLDLAIFLFLGLFTPGPNVIMLFSSGARFGFRATVPHLLGVVVGVGILGFLVGLGIGSLIFALPSLETALRLIAFLWILWLAWGIWTSAAKSIDASDSRPMRFIEAILFQTVNPKFWSVALAGAAYLIGRPALQQGLTLGGMAAAINLFVCLFWVICGHGLSRFLTASRARLYFYRIMAVLLAFSGLMVFF
ncbi:MAG: LysE family translocator [Pseudomonadota bacterium]